MACIKWVLPRPTPPYKNNGLNATFSLSAVRRATANASSFGLPTTKFAKVYLGSRPADRSANLSLLGVFSIDFCLRLTGDNNHLIGNDVVYSIKNFKSFDLLIK